MFPRSDMSETPTEVDEVATKLDTAPIDRDAALQSGVQGSEQDELGTRQRAARSDCDVGSGLAALGLVFADLDAHCVDSAVLVGACRGAWQRTAATCE